MKLVTTKFRKEQANMPNPSGTWWWCWWW